MLEYWISEIQFTWEGVAQLYYGWYRVDFKKCAFEAIARKVNSHI